MTYQLIDAQRRALLNEGRNRGIGLAFAKREGDTFTTVMPISACHDYLSDLIAAFHTGRVVSAHGLVAKPEPLISEGRAFLIMAVLKQGAMAEQVYPEYQKEHDQLAANYSNMTDMVNWFEDRLAIARSTITKVAENRYLVNVPEWWCKWTYLMSLYRLILRGALWYKEGDPIEYLQTCNEDQYLIRIALPKLDQIFKGVLPSQDFAKMSDYQIHNAGIINTVFPPIAA